VALTVRFVRHGESQANVDRIFANRVNVSARLTSAGIDQAWRLALTLTGVDVTHIYTSPLERARQTADVVGSHLGTLPMVRDALREYDVGAFEGLGYGGDDAWRWHQYERVDAAWRQGDRHARLAGGESLDDMAARFLRFMDHLATIHEADARILIVSHGGLYRLMFPLLLAGVAPDDPRFLHIGYCDVTTALHEGGAWRLRD
jgi:probable phosphoglycerate mutase